MPRAGQQDIRGWIRFERFRDLYAHPYGRRPAPPLPWGGGRVAADGYGASRRWRTGFLEVAATRHSDSDDTMRAAPVTLAPTRHSDSDDTTSARPAPGGSAKTSVAPAPGGRDGVGRIAAIAKQK